jgi:hypothetical protein
MHAAAGRRHFLGHAAFLDSRQLSSNCLRWQWIMQASLLGQVMHAMPVAGKPILAGP